MMRKTVYWIITLLIIDLNLTQLYAQQFNAHEFTVNGYVRTGIGWSGGGPLVNITTPENIHKFRMGNEADQYGELQLNYRYKNKDSIALYEVTYMMAKYIPYGDRHGFDQFPSTAQLYGKVNKITKNANLWLGKRYYDRRNVELLDYFWINAAQNSQVGLGIENYEIKDSGNLNLALIRFKYGTNTSHSYVADLRYLDIPIAQHSKLNLLGQYSYKTEQSLHADGHAGFALGSWWTYSESHITNTATVLYRKGSSMVQTTYAGTTVSEYIDGRKIYNLDQASSLNIINNFVYDDKQRHAVQAALSYQYTDFGIGNVTEENIPLDHKVAKNWFSIGFRYLYYISKHFNLALEAGNDYMKNSKLGLEGSLQKVTFSPQISWDYGYYSRPVLRPFITFAHWSDSFKGITGVSGFNNRLVNKNHGVSFGLQLEIWW